MSDEFIEYAMELFGPFGTVEARRMFGGHGVYLDGLMFALVSQDALYLKADEMNRIEFEQAGCEIFSYTRKGKRSTINFFRPPEDAMESPEMMLPWARTAYAAALRANAKKQVAGQAETARKAAREIALAATPATTAKAASAAKPRSAARAAKPAGGKPKKRKSAAQPPARRRGARK